MKAKTFLSLLLPWTMAAGALAEEQSKLLLFLKDGSSVEFVVPSQKPEITCARGYMQVNYQQGSTTAAVTFERSQVGSLKVLDEAEATAIKATTDNSQRVSFDVTSSSVVSVKGLNDGDRLLVYGLDGMRVNAGISRSGGEATVDLSQLRRGVYMVSVNGSFNFKLLKP